MNSDPNREPHATGAKPCGATARIIQASAVNCPQKYRRDIQLSEMNYRWSTEGFHRASYRKRLVRSVLTVPAAELASESSCKNAA